jgi:hypothetical protein
MYANSALSAPFSFTQNYNPPYFNVSEDFTVTVKATLAITAKESFVLSYGSVVAMNFDVDVS